MKIDRIQIKVRDLIDGYEEKGAEGIEGVVAYGGKLDVRPAYQREYIYGEKDRDEAEIEQSLRAVELRLYHKHGVFHRPVV